MAIRLQRVLIACGLPTIIAIVSFYWLRKRRKAVIYSTCASKQSSKEANITSSLDLESNSDLDSKPFNYIEIVEKVEKSPKKQNLIQSEPNCDSKRFPNEYTMQLRDNNNSGTKATDATTARDASPPQYITDNSGNSMANRIETTNSNSLGLKRQINCETNGNDYNCDQKEFNCKYNINEDKIVVKLSNFSLNNDNKDSNDCINDCIDSNERKDKKDSKDSNEDLNEINKNLTKKDSNHSIICDNSSIRANNEGNDSFGQNQTQKLNNNINSKSASIPMEANVGSHNDINDNNNDSKSITNTIIDSTCSHTNSKHNHNLDSDLIDAQKQNNSNSSQISIEVNNCVMSQTNTSSACSSAASCKMTNGDDNPDNGDAYHNYPDSSSVLHSPPHSAFSDVQSEGSSDSGKGGSDILHATPVEGPTLGLNPINETVIYQFEIPQYLCGRLIGSHGRFVGHIKRMTGTTVVINRHLYSSDMKICTLTGTKPAIKEALNQIRNRFPVPDYPNVSLQQINLINATQTCALPQSCQLQLPSGISCDVILSSLVSAGHFFLQQPTHPTYPSLSRLDTYMIQTYSHQNTPLLPNTIDSGMICAVPIMGGWFRAVITKEYDTNECDVMFVDYGGYSRLPVSSLRQIRSDFMSLPFQASECYLANIEPIDPEKGWTTAANTLFEELAQGQILQALIVGYSENGIPLVNLFKVQGISNVFINEELVNQSHAQWVESSA